MATQEMINIQAQISKLQEQQKSAPPPMKDVFQQQINTLKSAADALSKQQASAPKPTPAPAPAPALVYSGGHWVSPTASTPTPAPAIQIGIAPIQQQINKAVAGPMVASGQISTPTPTQPSVSTFTPMGDIKPWTPSVGTQSTSSPVVQNIQNIIGKNLQSLENKGALPTQVTSAVRERFDIPTTTQQPSTVYKPAQYTPPKQSTMPNILEIALYNTSPLLASQVYQQRTGEVAPFSPTTAITKQQVSAPFIQTIPVKTTQNIANPIIPKTFSDFISEKSSQEMKTMTAPITYSGSPTLLKQVPTNFQAGPMQALNQPKQVQDSKAIQSPNSILDTMVGVRNQLIEEQDRALSVADTKRVLELQKLIDKIDKPINKISEVLVSTKDITPTVNLYSTIQPLSEEQKKINSYFKKSNAEVSTIASQYGNDIEVPNTISDINLDNIYIQIVDDLSQGRITQEQADAMVNKVIAHELQHLPEMQARNWMETYADFQDGSGGTITWKQIKQNEPASELIRKDGKWEIKLDTNKWSEERWKEMDPINQGATAFASALMGGVFSEDFWIPLLQGKTDEARESMSKWQYDVYTAGSKGDLGRLAGATLSSGLVSNVIIPMAGGAVFSKIASSAPKFGSKLLTKATMQTGAKAFATKMAGNVLTSKIPTYVLGAGMVGYMGGDIGYTVAMENKIKEIKTSPDNTIFTYDGKEYTKQDLLKKFEGEGTPTLFKGPLGLMKIGGESPEAYASGATAKKLFKYGLQAGSAYAGAYQPKTIESLKEQWDLQQKILQQKSTSSHTKDIGKNVIKRILTEEKFQPTLKKAKNAIEGAYNKMQGRDYVVTKPTPSTSSIPRMKQSFFQKLKSSDVGRGLKSWSEGYKRGQVYEGQKAQYYQDSPGGVSYTKDGVRYNVHQRFQRFKPTPKRKWMSQDDINRFFQQNKNDLTYSHRLTQDPLHNTGDYSEQWNVVGQSSKLGSRKFDVTSFSKEGYYKYNAKPALETPGDVPRWSPTKAYTGFDRKVMDFIPEGGWTTEGTNIKHNWYQNMARGGYSYNSPTGFIVKDPTMAKFYGEQSGVPSGWVSGPQTTQPTWIEGIGQGKITSPKLSPGGYIGKQPFYKRIISRPLATDIAASQQFLVKPTVVTSPKVYSGKTGSIWKSMRLGVGSADTLVVPVVTSPSIAVGTVSGLMASQIPSYATRKYNVGLSSRQQVPLQDVVKTQPVYSVAQSTRQSTSQIVPQETVLLGEQYSRKITAPVIEQDRVTIPVIEQDRVTVPVQEQDSVTLPYQDEEQNYRVIPVPVQEQVQDEVLINPEIVITPTYPNARQGMQRVPTAVQPAYTAPLMPILGGPSSGGGGGGSYKDKRSYHTGYKEKQHDIAELGVITPTFGTKKKRMLPTSKVTFNKITKSNVQPYPSMNEYTPSKSTTKPGFFKIT
jgi:hypothetical protein